MFIQKRWIAAAVGLFAVAILAGVVLAWWLFNTLQVQFPLNNQQAQVKINDPILVQANVLNPLNVAVKGTLKTSIPIDQQIQVPVRDTVKPTVTFDHDVPIKVQIAVNNQIPIDQMVHINSNVQVKVLGKNISLPIQGDVPIKTVIPVNFKIPVDQNIRIRFVAPASATIDQRLNIPLKTTIDAMVAVEGKLEVPVKSQINTQVVLPKVVQATLIDSNIHFPLKAVSLGLRPAQQNHAGQLP